jgi:hypothetical protein
MPTPPIKPTKPAPPGTKAKISTNVPADLKNQVDAAARASGREQGEEWAARVQWSFDFERRLGGARMMYLLATLADVAQTKYPEGDWFDDHERFLVVCGLWHDTLEALVPPRPDAAQFVIDIGRGLIKHLAAAEGHQADHIRRLLRSAAASPLMPAEVRAEFMAAAGTKEEFPETPWRDDELLEEPRIGAPDP